jgi:membrane-anchored protein YejM (alkaline phosphatase superfamily)
MNFASKDNSLYNNAKNGTSFHILINMELTCCLQVFNFVFSSVHIVHFLGICLVMLCVILLEVDNFACSRFSLKEWAVTCILQKYFLVQKKLYRFCLLS